ncbi:exopolysaccharide biosynthesis polyprenyl glycosylphosphotransferase [Eubacterium ruminantium]|nr:exopolysaccharide biosynthesis polyprenyl glycosylphosphotransferase [Eubacterium ruminantium]
MNKGSTRAKHVDFIIIDFICVLGSMWLAFLIWIPEEEKKLFLNNYQALSLVMVLGYLFAVFFRPVHSGILRRGFLKELEKIILMNIFIMGVLLSYLFVVKITYIYSRMVFGLFFIFDVVFMTITHCIWKKVLIHKYSAYANQSKIMVVTYRKYLDDFLELINSNNQGFYHVVGILLLDDTLQPGEKYIDGIQVITKDGMLEYFRQNVVDEVYIKARKSDASSISNRFLSMGVTVNVTLNVFLSELNNVSLETVGDTTFVKTNINPITLGQQLVKRIFDIIISILGLVFTGLLTVFIAPIIKKQSPGPVFFKQERVGKNGRRFKMYKFRSMYMDAEERKKELMSQNQMQGLMFKMDDDPRITPIGKFLRKTSIDEFPQFLNILKGDMSLVGTRPPTVDEVEMYHLHHMSRLAIKPGLTGMWQTSGRSDITDFEEVVKLDNDYIRNFSLLLDVKIIIKTFGAVLGMKGSK